MTNSYKLSPRLLPNLILIHGMNNNKESFAPLKDELSRLGWMVHLITLPGHEENRKEARDLDSALEVFHQKMLTLTKEPYVVIAFSHGALYLQLWSERENINLPLKQVLLAPALYIHKQKIIEKILNVLPNFLFIKSLAPRRFRRYQTMNLWEYKILVHGMIAYRNHHKGFKTPTLIVIDPKDEVVNASLLSSQSQSENNQFVTFKFWDRNYLKRSFSCHHILFHPDYFFKEDWASFNEEINSFLT